MHHLLTTCLGTQVLAVNVLKVDLVNDLTLVEVCTRTRTASGHAAATHHATGAPRPTTGTPRPAAAPSSHREVA